MRPIHQDIIRSLLAIIDECRDVDGHLVTKHESNHCRAEDDLCGATICNNVGCVQRKLCSARYAVEER